MAHATRRDGTVVTWTGKQLCWCTHCEELFNSLAAFDAHLKRNGQRGVARHDITGMPRNAQGRLITRARDEA